MLTCPQGHGGKPGQRFCALCGGAYGTRCPHGHDVAPGTAFCGVCGSGVSGDGGATPPAARAWSDSPTLTEQPAGATVHRSTLPVTDQCAPPPAPTSATADGGGWSRAWKVLAAAAVLVAGAGVATALAVTSGGGGDKVVHASSITPKDPATPSTPVTVHGSATAAGGASAGSSAASGGTSGGDASSGDASGATNGTAGSGSTGGDGGAARAAAAIGSDLQQSASVRPAVQQAISGLTSCNESPSDAESAVQQAASTRQQIISSLGSLDASALPNGTQLVQTLTQALEGSVTSDNDYLAWMQDVASSGACSSDPSEDSNFQSAQSSDQTVNATKQTFTALWNPIAPQYGQVPYDPGTF